MQCFGGAAHDPARDRPYQAVAARLVRPDLTSSSYSPTVLDVSCAGDRVDADRPCQASTPQVVDPTQQKNLDQVFFGATVTYAHRRGTERTITIVGVDEADLDRSQVSWVSPSREH
jgi:Transcription elongation factor, GreA/GreB, C-term